MDGLYVSLSDLGARIRQERERLKLGVAEFAKRAGVSDRTQRNYESGERLPDAEYLAKAGVLGADTDFILFGDNAPTKRFAESVSDECSLLSDVLADLEDAINKAGVILEPGQKAKCIVHLYRLGRFGAPTDDPKILEELVVLAAGRQLL